MDAGIRSPLASWMGGAGAPPAAAGFRSPLAFWMGGASAGAAVVTEPDAAPRSFPLRQRVLQRKRRDRDDDVLIFLLR